MQTRKDSFENFLTTSETEPNLIETGDGLEIMNKAIRVFFNFNTFNTFSREASRVAVFVERVKRTLKNILAILLFRKLNAKRTDESNSFKRNYNSSKVSLVKLPSTKASSKRNEEFAHDSFLNESNKNIENFDIIT